MATPTYVSDSHAPSARCLYSSDAVVKSHVDTNDKNNIQNAKYLLNVWSTLVIRILHRCTPIIVFYAVFLHYIAPR